jgi:hypothetical protein
MKVSSMLPSWLRSLARFVNRPGQDSRPSASRRRRPCLEPLEDRLTPSFLINVTDHRDLVYDASRNELYITTASGKVQRWDVVGQQLLTAWNVGTSLYGADMTSNNAFLYVAENSVNATQGNFHQVDLSSGGVFNYPYTLAANEAGAWDISIAANGTALVTTQGSGVLPLRQFNANNPSTTNTYTIRTDDPGSGGGGKIQPDTLIHRGGDRSRFLLTESTLASGPVFYYTASTDSFSSSVRAGLALDNTSPVVNRNGTLMAVELPSVGNDTPGVSVFDSSFHSVQNLPGLTGGVIFDPTRDVLYGVNPTTGLILAYDTNTWALKYSLTVDETTTASTAFGNGVMVVTPDDHFLFLSTPTGVRQYILPQNSGVATSLSVTGFPSYILGGGTGSLTVTALDPAGNMVTNYTGKVHFTSTSAGTLPADYIFVPGDNGSHTFTGVSLTSTGTQSITATDNVDGISGSETNITVHVPNSNFVPVSNYRDLVYDQTRNMLDITTSTGQLYRYDISAQTLLAPIQVGAVLSGADITPDGSALYVADNERGLIQGWYHKVDLNTGAVTNLPYTSGGNSLDGASWDLAVGSNGKALASVRSEGTGNVFLHQINTATDAVTVRNDDPGSGGAGLLHSDTIINRSADRSLFVLAEGNNATGPIFTYSSAGDNFPHSAVLPGNLNNSFPVVNRNGTRIAVNLNGTIRILDQNFGNVQILPVSGGIIFDSTQDIMYVANVGNDKIYAYDTTNWNNFSQTAIGESMGGSFSTYGPGTMAISGDSRIFLGTPTGIRLFQVLNSFVVSGFPSTTTAGSTSSITVKAVDANGNTLTNYQGTVHFTSTDGQASLPADYTFVPGDNGVHTFNNQVTLRTAGIQSISAIDATNHLSGLEASITVKPDSPDHLAFGVQPTNTAVNTAISPAVQVQVRDQFNNVVTNDNSDQVAVSVASGPAGFTAGSTTSLTVTNGVANFSNLVLDTAGPYTLAENGVGNTLTGVNSSAFNVSGNYHLVFSAAVPDATAGAPISPAVRVEVRDQTNALVTNDNLDQITMAVASGPGGFLGGSTTSVTVSGGVATFSNLILTTGGSYTLQASATPTLWSNLGSVTSASFNVNGGAPDHLAFSVQPSNVAAGVPISPAVRVQIRDQFNNVVNTDNTDQVTVSVATGPGGFTGTSTTTVTVSNGVAVFNNLILGPVGTYTLSDSATGGLVGANSSSFTVRPGVADHLAFSVQPSDTTAGSAITPAVRVQVLDAFNNLLTGDNTDQVTLSVATGPGGFTGTSTLTATASGGIATFSNLVLTIAGPYTLAPSGTGGLTGVSSAPFSINAGAAHHLGFSVQPSNATAGTAINPAVQVQVEDRYNNPVTTVNIGQVTMSVATGPAGFAAGSTTTGTISAGVASFSNLILDTAAAYTLQASTTGLGSGTSASFSISASTADHVGFGVQPSTTSAGVAISPAVTVQVQDRFGNLVTGDNTDIVMLSVASGPGNFATGSTTTANMSNGVATFSNLIFTVAGSTYSLRPQIIGGVTGNTSNNFTISPTAPDHLGFSVQPSTTKAGLPISPAVKVQVSDRYDNLLTNDSTDQITLTASGPGNFAPGSTTTVRLNAGVATFSNLVFTATGAYTLQASGAGLSGTSNTFNVIPGNAAVMFLSTLPNSVPVGQAIRPAVTATLKDAFGNVLTNDNTDQISAFVTAGPASFAANSAITATVHSGVATFSRLVFSTAGVDTLLFIAPGGVFSTPTTIRISRSYNPPSWLTEVASELDHSSEYYTGLVRTTYQHLLHRTPLNTELSSVVAQMQGGLSDEQLEANLISSPEYIRNHGSTQTGWIRGMYQDLLNRTPTQPEINTWLGILNSGVSQTTAAYLFASGSEREGLRVTADYSLYLGRIPTPDEVNGWVQAFAHGLSNENVIAGFVGSLEYFQRQQGNVTTWFSAAYSAMFTADVTLPINMPSYLGAVAQTLTHSPDYYAVVVTNDYVRFIGRQPSATEVAGWVSALQNGLTDEQLEAGFIGSAEYITRHGGTDANGLPSGGWVTGMYNDLLGRDPSGDEINGWLQALAGGTSPSSIAYLFATSPEREGLRVTADYQQFLGRTPSQDEVNGWVSAFGHGTTNESIIAGFAGSAEFFQHQGNRPSDWMYQAVFDIFGPAGF